MNSKTNKRKWTIDSVDSQPETISINVETFIDEEKVSLYITNQNLDERLNWNDSFAEDSDGNNIEIPADIWEHLQEMWMNGELD